MGREQLATLLTIVAAVGERAWRARSMAAAWGEIIGKVHTGCTGLQPGGAWHGVAAQGCVNLTYSSARSFIFFDQVIHSSSTVLVVVISGDIPRQSSVG